MLWWIGNILLLVAALVAVALLSRLIGAVERIRKASDDILDLLAQTDTTVAEVADGAVRYAGSVAKLLPQE
jgi:hypothetical protein